MNRFELYGRLVLAVNFFSLLFLQTSWTAGLNKPAGFTESECPFPLPEGIVLGENFKFGYVEVPELHAYPHGIKIQLAVAIFPSSSCAPKPDPIIMNTSGPGKSNMDNFIPQIAMMLGKYLLPGRDIVIIELRGLRYSKPFLRCEELFEARKSILSKNLTTSETLTVFQDALMASKKRFMQEGINLSAFNNIETAADVIYIMDRLGYDKFNLVGSSAGTLVASHLIRDYPKRVRCAIMDAGLPIDKVLLRDYVPSFIQMLKQYFKECEQDPLYRAAYPDLEERFLEYLNELNSNPVMIPINDPQTGQEREYLLNGYRLAAYIAQEMFYTTQIPYRIHEILSGDYCNFTGYAQSALIPNHFADGLGYTVFLSEAGDYHTNDITIDPKYSIFAEGMFRMGLGGKYLREVQKIWDINILDAENILFQNPVDVPVIVLNGKYDPAIPEQSDAVMKAQFKHCYHYRFDGIAHSVFDNAIECALPMLLQFLDDPSNAPDSNCMEKYKQNYLLPVGMADRKVTQ